MIVNLSTESRLKWVLKSDSGARLTCKATLLIFYLTVASTFDLLIVMLNKNKFKNVLLENRWIIIKYCNLIWYT